MIRQSIIEVTADINAQLQSANLHSPVHIVVPSRYSIVAIGCPVQLPPDQWSRMSAIVRKIVGKRLGGSQLRGRPLARSVARAETDATDTTAG